MEGLGDGHTGTVSGHKVAIGVVGLGVGVQLGSVRVVGAVVVVGHEESDITKACILHAFVDHLAISATSWHPQSWCSGTG